MLRKFGGIASIGSRLNEKEVLLVTEKGHEETAALCPDTGQVEVTWAVCSRLVDITLIYSGVCRAKLCSDL